MFIFGTSYTSPTRDELAVAAYGLAQEFRGDSIGGENVIINSIITNEKDRAKLKKFATSQNIAQAITKKENPNYNKAPRRLFMNANKTVTKYIEAIYDELDLNIRFQEASWRAAYEGTVVLLPTTDDRDKKLCIVELFPSNGSFLFTPDIKFMDNLSGFQYNNGKQRIRYDEKNFYIKSENKTETTGTPHLFNIRALPILKYEYDPTAFWAPYDKTLLDLCNIRIYLQSEAVLKSGQIDAALILNNVGTVDGKGNVNTDLALQITQMLKSAGVAILPAQWDEKAQQYIPADVKMIEPTLITSKSVWELWMEIYTFVTEVIRGHAPMQFSKGADASTAEALRISGNDLYDKIKGKRMQLESFEYDFFEYLKTENNKYQTTKIPDNIQLELSWIEDSPYYSSTKDKIDDQQFRLNNYISTPVDLIIEKNPLLTKEAALKIYIEK